jgi:hypothetical protein
MSIEPTENGGILFDWICYIAWTQITIHPGMSKKIEYEAGYIDEDTSPIRYVTTEEGETLDYVELSEMVYSNNSHCLSI